MTATTHFYGVDLYRDGALVWGAGLPAKTRRDALRKVLANYRAAYPDAKKPDQARLASAYRHTPSYVDLRAAQ